MIRKSVVINRCIKVIKTIYAYLIILIVGIFCGFVLGLFISHRVHLSYIRALEIESRFHYAVFSKDKEEYSYNVFSKCELSMRNMTPNDLLDKMNISGFNDLYKNEFTIEIKRMTGIFETSDDNVINYYKYIWILVDDIAYNHGSNTKRGYSFIGSKIVKLFYIKSGSEEDLVIIIIRTSIL